MTVDQVLLLLIAYATAERLKYAQQQQLVKQAMQQATFVLMQLTCMSVQQTMMQVVQYGKN
jgi:hypothetical protein